MSTLPDMAAVSYRKRAVSGRAWAAPGVLALIALAYSLVTEHGDRMLGSLAVMLGLIAVIGGIWVLTLYSMNRYGTVTITGDTLRVGRDRLPLDRIDLEWVRMLASKASPTLRERVLTSASTIQVPAHVQLDARRGRLLGGAYGTSVGSDQVTLRLTDGSRVTAPSNDREGLLAALLTALGH
jgi:hypothetical protein